MKLIDIDFHAIQALSHLRNRLRTEFGDMAEAVFYMERVSPILAILRLACDALLSDGDACERLDQGENSKRAIRVLIDLSQRLKLEARIHSLNDLKMVIGRMTERARAESGW